MHQPLLIADSGGTKTDWCYIDENKEKHFFTSESYHPSSWSDHFVERIRAYWSKLSDYKQAELHFFCAGCLKIEKANELQAIFTQIGFSKINVKSDLHAAGLALFGKESGNVAILGTGSVYFEWKDCGVTSIIGGKGFEIGDEGSGFYFGKLVFQDFKENKLTSEQKKIIEEKIIVSDFEEALIDLKTFFSQFPNELKQHKSEFSSFHTENVGLFFESIKKNNSILTVRVIGSYFSAHSSILIPFLSQKNIKVEQFTDRPIDSLVDYFMLLSE